MNTQTTEKIEHIIDADGKKLGRIASSVAALLLGKKSPSFAKNQVADVSVIINNASRLDLSEGRLSKEYKKYSGYPGGLRFETRGHFIERRGYAEMIRKTVRGMLPANRLRDKRLANLTIND